MFTINFRHVLTSLLVVLLVGCIFSNWTLAQEGKIDPNVLVAAQAGGTIAVGIRLQDQPSSEIAPAVHAQFIPTLDAISLGIRNKTLPFHQQGQPLPENVKQEVKALQEDLDRESSQMCAEIEAQLWNRVSGS